MARRSLCERRLSLVEVVPLYIGGPSIVGSAVTVGMALQVVGLRNRQAIFRGLLAGLVAVLIYDCTRLPFVIFGSGPDFIPKIGAWLTNEPEAHWLVGYLWRYLGNGAGMGLAFAMTVTYTDRWIGRCRAGLLYGIAIWTGLILTVLIAPNGQNKMFPLNPATIAASLTGHLVYGAVLGVLLRRWSEERGCERVALER